MVMVNEARFYGRDFYVLGLGQSSKSSPKIALSSEAIHRNLYLKNWANLRDSVTDNFRVGGDLGFFITVTSARL